MIEYTSAGTLGDAFIISCKIRNITQGDVHLHHFTRHKNMYKGIKEVYKLFDINVSFVDHMISCDFPGYFVGSEFEEKYFPDISKVKDLYKKFNLPEKYRAISLRSGRPDQKDREIKDLKTQKNDVIIGRNYDYSGPGLNLIDKTSLAEVFSIIMQSDRFIGYQGLLCFIALSQRVPTITYTSGKYKRSMNIRTAHCWKQYLTVNTLNNTGG